MRQSYVSLMPEILCDDPARINMRRQTQFFVCLITKQTESISGEENAAGWLFQRRKIAIRRIGANWFGPQEYNIYNVFVLKLEHIYRWW